MLGSATEAEDIVQESYVRWSQRGDDVVVESVRSYLVTIVTRLCIDHLTSARAGRLVYSGPWLPEPIEAEQSSALEQSDSLTLAFLVLLEELTPPERAVYLLHDIFGYRFDEIAESVGHTVASCRQMASRARRRIEGRRQRFDAELQHGRELTREFVAACATGDLEGLRRLLAEDVVVWTDGDGRVRAAPRPVVGAYRSSRFLLHVGRNPRGIPREMTLNGRPALVFIEDAQVLSALVLDFRDEKIVAVRVVTNPDKLAWLSCKFGSNCIVLHPVG